MQIECCYCKHEFDAMSGVLAINRDLIIECPFCHKKFRITPLFVRMDDDDE